METAFGFFAAQVSLVVLRKSGLYRRWCCPKDLKLAMASRRAALSGNASLIATFSSLFLVRAIAIMFVSPSVCLPGTGVHCDHTVHVSVGLSLWLDSPRFWAL